MVHLHPQPEFPQQPCGSSERRRFFQWTSVFSLVLFLSACSAGTDKTLTIVFVGYGPAAQFAPYAKFQQALREQQAELAGRLRYDYLEASAEDEAEMGRLIEQALAREPAVLVALTGEAAAIAARATRRVPIVFTGYVDPVRSGLVRSLREPGGNVTGISLADWMDAKRLEILRDAFPAARRVAVLTDRSWQHHYDGEARIVADAQALGLQATVLYADSAEQLPDVMATDAARAYDAWYVLPTFLAYRAEAEIAAHLRRLQAPAIHATVGEVARGGALGYAVDESFVYPTLAQLVARVAGGEDPATIPIERPRRYRLAVRAEASCRSQAVAASLIRRADLVF